MPPSIAAMLCVCGIAAGQLLFKFTADSQALSGSYFHPRTLRSISALLLWGHHLWMTGPFSRDHFRGSISMALAFMIVPLLSAVILRAIPTNLLARVVMIVAGVSIAVRSCTELRRDLCGLLVISGLLIGATTPPSFHLTNMLI